MFAHFLAGGRAALNLALAVIIGIFIGGLLATPADEPVPDSTATTTVAALTPQEAREVTRLADALEALTTTTVPAAAAPLVDRAEDVLDDVREQAPAAVPAPPDVAEVPPTVAATTTTTHPPLTTSTTYAHDLMTVPP